MKEWSRVDASASRSTDSVESGVRWSGPRSRTAVWRSGYEASWAQCSRTLIFVAAFAPWGGPSTSPGLLALVSVLQFAERLTDRQVADAVRGRIDGNMPSAGRWPILGSTSPCCRISGTD